MSDIIKTINLKDNHILEIYHDPSPESPREWSNLGVMAIFHGRYNFGDKVPFNADMFEGWGEMEAYIVDTLKAVVCLPIYMYNHSGITINTTGFSCKWDSGQVGFIYATNKTIDELGTTINNDESWSDYTKRLKEQLVAEVKTMDQHITGDVYGFEVKDGDGEHVDSCSGFYGSDLKTNGLLDNVDEALLDPAVYEEL